MTDEPPGRFAFVSQSAVLRAEAKEEGRPLEQRLDAARQLVRLRESDFVRFTAMRYSAAELEGPAAELDEANDLYAQLRKQAGRPVDPVGDRFGELIAVVDDEGAGALVRNTAAGKLALLLKGLHDTREAEGATAEELADFELAVSIAYETYQRVGVDTVMIDPETGQPHFMTQERNSAKGCLSSVLASAAVAAMLITISSPL